MDINRKKSNERALTIAIVILLSITILSLISTIFLLYDNAKLRAENKDNKQTIIAPMVNNLLDNTYSFYGERGDANYLRLMGLSFLSLRLDVNAQIVEQSHEILLNHVSNELREKIIPVLAQEKKSINVDNGSSVFYVKKLQVSPNNGIIDAQGDLVFSYGIRKTSPVTKHYRLRIDSRNGKPVLTDFTEIIDEK
ncbi:TraE/TraK family type IV conjugative transfer system protein [Glaesserella parasuis]|nr:traE family protein [Glaesserella parasuis 174]MCT8756548.1 hypothetical protein [Glaesserella parasuis]MDD2170363.1 hypothetical protein [Glaesserella parasuis]MDO9767927.1 TraE/TraK family type IV conjugative transfer system protein [Glaesserella parasuis]MDO9922502.1 TraE/TraK family type IV conjugative transfer system protein [Glaesserella parasuis]